VIEPFAANWKKVGRAVDEIRSEAGFSRRLKNIGHLLAGNFGAAAVSMGTVAIAARALSVERYGELALIVSFVQAIERFCSFQSWQPVIRYGANLRESGRLADLGSLLKFAFLLDVAAAIFGFALACALAYAGAAVFGWSDGVVIGVVIYASVLLFAVTGVPTGVLRLAGKFREIAYFQVVAMAVRLALCFAAMLAGGGLITFLAIWTATHILGHLLLIATGYGMLGKINARDFLRRPIGGISQRFPKIWRFSILSNLSLSVRSSSQQLDTLLVGAFAGAGGAGVYHIAKRISKFALQAGQQVQAVVFPDVAKLWAKGDIKGFQRVVTQTETLLVLICGAGILATLLLADPVVRVLAGEDFAAAAALLKVQIFAVAFLLCGSVTRTGLLCMGRESSVLALAVVATIAFFLSAAFLLPRIGPIGANTAHVIQGAILFAGLLAMFRTASGRAVADPSSTPPTNKDRVDRGDIDA
jgi:O-antigen/teichoic acid export membrane protein